MSPDRCRLGGACAPVGTVDVVQHALYLPPFGALAEPARLVEVARVAEAAGWDGLFLWDHVLRDPDEVGDVADAWIALAAIACATERIRIGPMVTPISRRRIPTLVRQAVTLDHLSGGRLTMGLGLGVDTTGELSKFGEIVDPKARGRILDEGADLLARAWAGEHLVHHGPHFTVDGVTFSPTPVQRPRIPLWFAARGAVDRPVRRPVQRAARYDGLFAIEVDATGLASMLDEVRSARGGLEAFDVAVLAGDGMDPDLLGVDGVTWAMHWFVPDVAVTDVLDRADAGPPQS